MRAERGFTLIEMLMVAALVSVFLTLGVVTFRQATAREQIDGWVRSITSDIASGQQAAITRRTVVTATFQNQTYSITAGTTILRQETLPPDITFGGTLQTLTFDRRGTPSGALTLTITSTATARSYHITIDAGTGRVTFNEL